MTKFKRVTVEATPYLYVERQTSMDPADISKAMGEGFGAVMGFMSKHGIPPKGRPMSVYYGYEENSLAFRVGFPVAREALAASEGEVQGDETTAGEVLHFTHVGPYATLRDEYGEMMGYMKDEGLQFGEPTWEVYVDDPGEVPEERLRTDIYVTLA